MSGCHVTYLGSKVEIKLKKTGPPLFWKTLALEERESLPGIENINIQDSENE